jgi:hypothetical protein
MAFPIKCLMLSLTKSIYFHAGKRDIKALRVKCRHLDMGCEWEGTVGTLKVHVATCDFKPASESKEDMDDTEDSGADVMSYKDACLEISDAISKGAPTYNKGDHLGCYKTYRQAAERIIERCSLSGVRKELRSALDLAIDQETFTKQAWTMRRAFDAIVGGDIDTADFTDSDKKELPSDLSGGAMSYKGVCREIAAAIDKGAPVYDSGDHSGCYNTYKEAAERIVESCSVSLIKQKLSSALELSATQQNYSDRAWTLRRAFDMILCGVIVITASAASGSGSDDSDGSGMGYRDICREISSAISKGAPTYNEGDHNGCYQIYKETAEKILENCSVGTVQQELRLALDTAADQENATVRAWTMRHAFDAILRGRLSRAAEFGGSVRLNTVVDPASFGELLGRRGTL